jgi:outer membrane protein
VNKQLVIAAALLSATLSAVCLPAQADQGDILARVRAISIEPDVSSGGTLSTLGTGVKNAIVPELDFVYMVRQSIGIELILATSRHEVTSNVGALGGVNVLPPTLLLQYYFNSAGKIRPYVGAGLNYTLFYNTGLHAGDTPVSIKDSSFGPALQAVLTCRLLVICSSTSTSRRSGCAQARRQTALRSAHLRSTRWWLESV